jgi:Mrp family chromosome partitioning ATPase
VSTWLARAEGWLLEPPRRAAPAFPGGTGAAEVFEPPPPPPVRPVVAVVGLARGCGATTLARALAVELAARDPARAAIVVSAAGASGPPIPASPMAVRLARSLRAAGCHDARAAGRICLAGALPPPAARPAPAVIDCGRAGPGPALADRTVIVAGPRVEPSLAQVVASSLERSGRAPAILANRVEEAERWQPIGALVVPESRVAAVLALAGREPRGALGAAVRRVVDGWEGGGW